MTAFVVDLRRERAVVVADTGAYLDGAPPRLGGFVTKVHPLPHLHALLFGRGPLVVPAEAALRVNLSPDLGTIERVVEAMPAILRRSAAGAACEVYLVGWSERQRRMRFFAWCSPAWTPLEDGGDARMFMLPTLPGQPVRQGAFDAHLVSLMKHARRHFEANPEGGALVGGAVQKWAITRDGISQTVIHRFVDGPIDMAERLAAA